MTVQVTPVRTTGAARTERTDSTAAVQQDLMGHNVKQVTKAKIHCPSYVRRFLITFYVVCTAFTFKLPEKGRNIFFLFQLFILQILLLLFLSSMASINFLRYLLKTDIDDCSSHPCKNNGTCTDRVNRFNCNCEPGFNGTQCETGNYSQN